MGREGVKLISCLKLVRFMIETHIISENILLVSRSLNFADVSIFFTRNQRFLVKIVLSLKKIV